MLGILIRIALVVAYALVVLWWPGLLWMSLSIIPTMPLLAIASMLVMSFIAVLILPLSRTWFVASTSVVIVGVLGIVVYKGYEAHLPFMDNERVLLWVIVVVAVVLGWVLSASRVWRWAKGILPVADQHSDGPVN